jgi:hypothetical protein
MWVLFYEAGNVGGVAYYLGQLIALRERLMSLLSSHAVRGVVLIFV